MSETTAETEHQAPSLLTKLGGLLLTPVRVYARRDPDGADRLLRATDRIRRSAGIGPSFPITHYDVLDEGRVIARLVELTPAQLRKVRDYERHHAKRKTVLDRIESELNY